jgi:ferrochelatase
MTKPRDEARRPPKIAVILFNLGGPDSPQAVRPFLVNLFRDPAILRVPGWLRPLLARIIAGARSRKSRAVYAKVGGRSPILAETRAQADKLTAALGKVGIHASTHIVMRYWHPRAAAVAAEVKAENPDKIILLPLYPQWSSTTSASSLQEWKEAARKAGLEAPQAGVCCYPVQQGFIGAYVKLIRQGLLEAQGYGRPKLVFSCHGLPEKIIADGDPYQWQCEQTAAAIDHGLARLGLGGYDSVVSYQSKVGPIAWIGPDTEAEIEQAGRERRPVVVAPISFVSEHVETLVEIEQDYRALAAASGVPHFVRVPAVGADQIFINGLVELVQHALKQNAELSPAAGVRVCPAQFAACAQQSEAETQPERAA